MKKALFALTIFLSGSFAVLAGPPHPGPGCRSCPGAWHPCRPWHPCPRPAPWYPCPGPYPVCYNNGLINAAAITSIVANGLSILNSTVVPSVQVVTSTQPVIIQQPVSVVQQPIIIQQPVVVTPVTRTIIVQ